MTLVEELSESMPGIANDPNNDLFIQEFVPKEPPSGMWGWVVKVLYALVILGLLYFRWPNFYIKAGVFAATSLALQFIS